MSEASVTTCARRLAETENRGRLRSNAEDATDRDEPRTQEDDQ